MQKKDMKDVNEREVPGSRWCYWRNAQSQSAPISLVLLAIPAQSAFVPLLAMAVHMDIADGSGDTCLPPVRMAEST